MASISHLAVGAAAGRLIRGRRSVWAPLLVAVLSMLPDADVVAFSFGIPYSHPFGHRGASHSIVFALACGGLAAAIAALSRQSNRPGALAGRWGLGVFLAVLTHPLLDMLTTGGLGVALFWPFSDARVFFPWRVIPVAPIGWGMLSPAGAAVVSVELLPSLLLVGLAAWPRGDTPRSRS